MGVRDGTCDVENNFSSQGKDAETGNRKRSYKSLIGPEEYKNQSRVWRQPGFFAAAINVSTLCFYFFLFSPSNIHL